MKVIQKVEELSLLAPLHNPANATEDSCFQGTLPDITSVVRVFDTSFHTTMPEKAYHHLPTKYYTEKQRYVNMAHMVLVMSM